MGSFENRDPLKGDGNAWASSQAILTSWLSTLKTETRLKGMETMFRSRDVPFMNMTLKTETRLKGMETAHSLGARDCLRRSDDFENRDPLKGDGNLLLEASGHRLFSSSTLKTETRLKGMETRPTDSPAELGPLISFENRDPLKGDGNARVPWTYSIVENITLKTETRLKGMETGE